MWIIAAFQCFFALLFTGKLPASAAARLPAGARSPALGLGGTEPDPVSTEPAAAAAERDDHPVRTAPASGATLSLPPDANTPKAQREGALALLSQLQREGRLVDFLQESIDDYSDEDVGAAVRDIHRGCKKVLDQHLQLEPVMPGDEDDAVKVPAGFDPGEIKLNGQVQGNPPFAGTLRHHGWRATRFDMPSLAAGVDRRILAPAEVEIE